MVLASLLASDQAHLSCLIEIVNAICTYIYMSRFGWYVVRLKCTPEAIYH